MAVSSADKKKLGKWIKQAREKKQPHLSQRQLALAVDITNASLSSIESGMIFPSEELLLKLIEQLQPPPELREKMLALFAKAKGTSPPDINAELSKNPKLWGLIRQLAFCARALNAIKASCLNSEFGAEHKLLSQMPITNFLQSIEGGKEMTLADKEKAYLWFISFVYRLRNALFHEIIDPLNDEWQVIFKNSYHVLKQVVDQNIWRLKQLKLLPSASQAAAEEDYNREPPPDIDWPTDEEAKFTWFYYEMLKLNKDGARVLLKGKIDFAEHHYETECTVRWNESLSETAIKNASITSVVDSQEKELAAAI